MTGRFEGSTRRAELPTNWKKIRARVMARDNRRCTWPVDGGRCGQPATDCDHISDRNDHRDENLRALCRTHHDQHTSAQGNAARWQHKRTRPTSTHPGLR